MTKKSVYALQPYEVGRKNSKSLVIVIPARVVKEQNINTSTIFVLQTDPQTKVITLQVVQTSCDITLENTKHSPQTVVIPDRKVSQL
jgi:hypothetical protein